MTRIRWVLVVPRSFIKRLLWTEIGSERGCATGRSIKRIVFFFTSVRCKQIDDLNLRNIRYVVAHALFITCIVDYAAGGFCTA